MESKMDQYCQEMLALYHREDFTVKTGYSVNRSTGSSFIHLQRQLALRTFCLREYILTPLMKHFLNSRSKNELVRLYRAYCYFFDRELTVREFSAFLVHVIIYRRVSELLKKAGIFSSKTDFEGQRDKKMVRNKKK
jgi:hypothetical protein